MDMDNTTRILNSVRSGLEGTDGAVDSSIDRRASKAKSRGKTKPGTTPQLAKPHNPFPNLSRHVASPFMGPDAAALARKHTVTIAMVSMPEIEGTIEEMKCVSSNDSRIDPTAVLRKLFRQSHNQGKTYSEAYIEALCHCTEELKADIIIFNELAIPTHQGKPQGGVMKAIRRCLRKHPCLIVAGSHHDKRTFMNTGYVFSPAKGCERGIPFHKNVSAPAAHEMITTPPYRRILFTRAFGLGIAVLVCLDLADYAVVSAAVRVAQLTDMILVCCYTEDVDQLKRVATVASKAIAGYVVMVNYQRREDAVHVRIIKNGKTEKAPPMTMLQHGAGISTISFDREQMQAERDATRASRDSNDELQWLFGPPVLDVLNRTIS